MVEDAGAESLHGPVALIDGFILSEETKAMLPSYQAARARGTNLQRHVIDVHVDGRYSLFLDVAEALTAAGAESAAPLSAHRVDEGYDGKYLAFLPTDSVVSSDYSAGTPAVSEWLRSNITAAAAAFETHFAVGYDDDSAAQSGQSLLLSCTNDVFQLSITLATSGAIVGGTVQLVESGVPVGEAYAITREFGSGADTGAVFSVSGMLSSSRFHAMIPGLHLHEAIM